MGRVAGVATPLPLVGELYTKKVIICFLWLQPPFWSAPDKYSHEGLQPPPPPFQEFLGPLVGFYATLLLMESVILQILDT